MIIAINKPKGPSSFNIISRVRKAAGVKKVGHAGTLDPLASGVLVVAIGRESTREISKIVDKEKEYVAEFKLGFESETDDEEGVKTPISLRQPSKKEVEKAIKKFIGKIRQVPPKFSAIKISGQRAYKMARAGEQVKMKARPVIIKNIKLIEYKYPFLRLEVVCGPGVYIRSLARDIGTQLGVGAYMSNLVRTRVGEFRIDQAADGDNLSRIQEMIEFNEVANKLRDGQIGVMPSDTIYGLLGQALNKKVVQRIYHARLRDPEKPCIILVDSIDELKLFGIKIKKNEREIISKLWPGKVSIVLPCKSNKFSYLHRGTKTLALRLPDKSELIHVIRTAGPLLAPSANPEGQPVAQNISQAKKYFSDNVDFYLSGETNDEPSTLVKFEKGKLVVLREGAVKINDHVGDKLK